VFHLTGGKPNDCVAEYVERNGWPQENLKEDGENYTLKKFAPVTKYYSSDQAQEGGIGGIRSTLGSRNEIHT